MLLHRNWKLVVGIVLLTTLGRASATRADNIRNFWFYYIFNQHGTAVSYTVTNIPQGGVVGGAPLSGTIPSGGSVYFYFGNQNSGEQVSAGAMIVVTDSSGASVGDFEASASDANTSNGCFMSGEVISLKLPYTVCGRFNQNAAATACSSPCSLYPAATGSGLGESSSSQLKVPNIAFTICK